MTSAVSKLEQLQDPVESAQAVGLRYVSDELPGIVREKSGRQFRYRTDQGKVVRDQATLARIRSLAIPPAWTEVWICPDPKGHLQATGRDAKGRKQHRYHPHWREVRDETKYSRMIDFACCLPRIRRRIQRDLKLPGLPRNKVLATVVRLLEVSLIRVGNDEYARANDSFGLTTMRDRHVDVNGSKLKFHFRGKAGKWHEVDIRDRRLAAIVKSCQDLPGQELFQYLDEEGRRQDVRSGDVNEYLREISGKDFTAKDFRTWAGTILGAQALKNLKPFSSRAEAKRNLARAIESVAERLGNTPAVCRKCYMHPDLINCYLGGTLASMLGRNSREQSRERFGALDKEERAVLALLRRQRLTPRQREGLLPKLLKRSLAQWARKAPSRARQSVRAN